MPFRPHSLPYKLRRLIDAKVCSPQDIARSVGMPVSRVDGWLRGQEPDPVTRLQIDKVLAYYTRLGHRHLKLVLEDEPIEQAESIAGVFEEMDSSPGIIEVKARDAAGGRLALLQFRAGTLDDELIADLERWHARYSATHLTLAESSGQA